MAFALTSMDPPRPDDPDGPKALGLVVVGSSAPFSASPGSSIFCAP
jgi:hypothetical protein